MFLQKVQLTNFRNYRDNTFIFSPDVTIVIGPNTSGKTNLLEAVFYLSCGKSFKAEQEKEVIRESEELARIKAILKEDSKPQTLEVVVTDGMVMGKKAPRKKLLVNGVSKRMMDFADNFTCVLFWPEDLELITDSPSLRRNYLDNVLSSVSRQYRRAIFNYDKALRIRNKILKDKREILSDPARSLSRISNLDEQLAYWGERLIESGNIVTKGREEYVNFINKFKIQPACRQGRNSNFKKDKKLQITYFAFYDKSEISEKRLAQYKQEEVWAGSTLVGPHRDDLVVSKNSPLPLPMAGFAGHSRNKELSKFGSRGEQRLGVLWLKLAEIDFVEKKTGVRPILLLDDIFSEFDQEHRELVFSVVDSQQTIVTTADEHLIPSSFFKKAQAIKLGL